MSIFADRKKVEHVLYQIMEPYLDKIDKDHDILDFLLVDEVVQRAYETEKEMFPHDNSYKDFCEVLANRLFMYSHLVTSGNKTYLINNKNLIEAFKNTKVNCPFSEIKLPYQYICLLLDGDILYVSEYEEDKIFICHAVYTLNITLDKNEYKDLDTLFKAFKTQVDMNHQIDQEGIEQLRMILNLILYISSDNSDILKCFPPKFSPSKKLRGRSLRRARDRHEDKHGSDVYYLVGKNETFVESKECQGLWKQEVRTLVTGHWHFYWVGSRILENRKRIHKWIKPYWRGPELGEISNKLRVVQSSGVR